MTIHSFDAWYSDDHPKIERYFGEHNASGTSSNGSSASASTGFSFQYPDERVLDKLVQPKGLEAFHFIQASDIPLVLEEESDCRMYAGQPEIDPEWMDWEECLCFHAQQFFWLIEQTHMELGEQVNTVLDDPYATPYAAAWQEDLLFLEMDCDSDSLIRFPIQN